MDDGLHRAGVRYTVERMWEVVGKGLVQLPVPYTVSRTSGILTREVGFSKLEVIEVLIVSRVNFKT
jgi:hypothetical protein